MEKLEIMIMLASDKTIDHVLLELKRYATEADVEFVRKAIRAIGRCAIKLQNAAERCIHVLLELIQSDEKYNAVVQEAIVVIKVSLQTALLLFFFLLCFALSDC
jgi:AP-1 complex subunit beta-1